MPFNTLLLTCLTLGRSYSESGIGVQMRSKPGEVALFFAIDDQTNPSSTLRSDLGIEGSICDCIVYYVQENRKVICFVELKGRDVKHAGNQVLNTYRYFKQSLDKRLRSLSKACRSQLGQIEWMGLICYSSAAPSGDVRAVSDRFKKEFGKNKYDIKSISSKRSYDLGELVRK